MQLVVIYVAFRAATSFYASNHRTDYTIISCFARNGVSNFYTYSCGMRTDVTSPDGECADNQWRSRHHDRDLYSGMLASILVESSARTWRHFAPYDVNDRNRAEFQNSPGIERWHYIRTSVWNARDKRVPSIIQSPVRSFNRSLIRDISCAISRSCDSVAVTFRAPRSSSYSLTHIWKYVKLSDNGRLDLLQFF